ERVPRLGLVSGSFCETKVPRGVLVPRMRLQEGVLVVGAWLCVAPIAVEHVLTSVDELACSRDGLLVHGIRRHPVLRLSSVGIPGGGPPPLRRLRPDRPVWRRRRGR